MGAMLAALMTNYWQETDETSGLLGVVLCSGGTCSFTIYPDTDDIGVAGRVGFAFIVSAGFLAFIESFFFFLKGVNHRVADVHNHRCRRFVMYNMNFLSATLCAVGSALYAIIVPRLAPFGISFYLCMVIAPVLLGFAWVLVRCHKRVGCCVEKK